MMPKAPRKAQYTRLLTNQLILPPKEVLQRTMFSQLLRVPLTAQAWTTHLTSTILPSMGLKWSTVILEFKEELMPLSRYSDSAKEMRVTWIELRPF